MGSCKGLLSRPSASAAGAQRREGMEPGGTHRMCGNVGTASSQDESLSMARTLPGVGVCWLEEIKNKGMVYFGHMARNLLRLLFLLTSTVRCVLSSMGCGEALRSCSG